MDHIDTIMNKLKDDFTVEEKGQYVAKNNSLIAKTVTYYFNRREQLREFMVLIKSWGISPFIEGIQKPS